MLTEHQRERVWEGWLSAEIRANYFADLSGRYYAQQRLATWLTLVLSSGAFVTVITQLPPAWSWLPPALTLIIAAVSLYALVTQHQKRAVDSAELHERWNRLAHDYAALWDNMYAEDAPARLAELEARAVELSKIGTAFPANRRRLLKWQDHVERHHAARMA